ncbi:hypothetical protein DPEC_G00057950 [Dallia pectoralis]|uniref:Uncharacterized protein n=1 Tax=Dallia pectoralis TaxID=75939 RepID=A0ACC2H621_DALPE|nr:hypothetical protein DPEC_G00057950 [Dallia pectoralis]
MSAFEDGGAGPAWGVITGEPQGGAVVTDTCEDKTPHALLLGRNSDAETRRHRGHGSGESLGPAAGGAQCECNVDYNDGERRCLPSEEGKTGGSREKTRTMHSNCSSQSSIPTPSCRICFQGAEQGELLNPCRCDGSVRHTHQHCLLKWISEKGSWTCELCCYRFHVIAINLKTPSQWQAITITLMEKVQIIAVLLGSLFLVSSISWLMWSALSPQALWQRRDTLFQICYGMYSFMDLVCIVLIVHERAAVHTVFMRWRAVNLHWDVKNYDKAADMEEAGCRSQGIQVPRTLLLPLNTLGTAGPSQPTRLEPQPWTSLCFPPVALCCPPLATDDRLSQNSASGESVIRVTSV